MEELATRCSQYVGLALFEKDMKLIRQIEYYFSDINLPGDKFLFDKTMKRNSLAWVPIRILQTFRKIKDYNFSDNDISWAINRYSSTLRVNRHTLSVRRKEKLPYHLISEKNTTERCLRIDNIPINVSASSLEKLFSKYGKVRCVRIDNSSPVLFAIVEYESRIVAESAMLMIKNSANWRFGLKAKLLDSRKRKSNKLRQKDNVKTFKNALKSIENSKTIKEVSRKELPKASPTRGWENIPQQ